MVDVAAAQRQPDLFPHQSAALLQRCKKKFGVRSLHVARPAKAGTKVKTIAVAAGAGGSVLRGARADVWVTGEMSHHDALAAVRQALADLPHLPRISALTQPLAGKSAS